MTEFPILGTEPIAVEFANTRYGDDFLRTDRLVDEWFAEVGRPARDLDPARARVLRDHVHALFEAVVAGSRPAAAIVAEVNGFVAAAPPALALDWAPDGTRRAGWVDAGAGGAAVLARIATDAVEVLTGAGLARCAGPGCPLFFVRATARRRFCHPSCGHRDRQARYYRRHRSPR